MTLLWLRENEKWVVKAVGGGIDPSGQKRWCNRTFEAGEGTGQGQRSVVCGPMFPSESGAGAWKVNDATKVDWSSIDSSMLMG